MLYWQASLITPNEGRADFGHPRGEGGDSIAPPLQERGRHQQPAATGACRRDERRAAVAFHRARALSKWDGHA